MAADARGSLLPVLDKIWPFRIDFIADGSSYGIYVEILDVWDRDLQRLQ